MRALEAVVKDVDDNAVTKVTGLEANVETVRAYLDCHVAEVRDVEAALKEKEESIVAIHANMARMIYSMQTVFGSGPSAYSP